MIWLLACGSAINSPPYLVTSTLADGETLYVPLVGVTVSVTASDDDGDALQFRWAIDGIGVNGDDDLGTSASTSSYNAYGESLDGAVLSVSISDGQDGVGLNWPMVAVE